MMGCNPPGLGELIIGFRGPAPNAFLERKVGIRFQFTDHAAKPLRLWTYLAPI